MVKSPVFETGISGSDSLYPSLRVQKIKTIENRVWNLCRSITRAKYPHVCISCGKAVEGKSLHTGHFWRKKFIPLQIKYRLDIIRNQCSYCNLRLGGNLEWYTIGLIKEGYTTEKFLEIAKDIEDARNNPLSTSEQREFLLDLERQYIILDKSYQRMA